MKKIFLLAAFALLSLNSVANAAEWKIVPQKSKIEFVAMQNDAKVSGSFKNFSGKINFDKAQLTSSKVEIEIDMNSVEASLSDAAPTLKTSEWFAVKAFPKATFVSEKFTKISDKKFSADAKLTIKNKAVPTKIEFAFEEYSTNKAKAVGTATIKRSDFGVGAKDPANAHGVKDDVVVSFVVEAVK